jgi:hypothetical protein
MKIPLAVLELKLADRLTGTISVRIAQVTHNK